MTNALKFRILILWQPWSHPLVVNAVYDFYSIVKSRLGLLISVPLLGHISTQHIKLHPKVRKPEDVIMYRKCGRLWWKIFRNHNFWQNLIFFPPCREQTMDFHKYSHTEPQSLCCSPTCPLCPLIRTLLWLLLFNSVFSTPSSTNVRLSESWGCYWLTNNERQRERDWHRREKSGGQRRLFEGLSKLEGLFLSFLKHHYWAKDTKDTGWRIVSITGVWERAKGQV